MDILIIALIIVQTLIIVALLKTISGKSNGKNDEKLESIAQDIASTKEELRKTASDISNLKMETQNSGSLLRKYPRQTSFRKPKRIFRIAEYQHKKQRRKHCQTDREHTFGYNETAYSDERRHRGKT